jgi:spore coat polysaccharide biosynthesis protein SpsF
MKTAAIIPVRMASNRLPGKALVPINSKPVLGHLIDRLRTCKSLDEVIVATSLNREDQAILDYCQNSNVICFRGSEDDVLGRLVLALENSKVDIGVLTFGDGPLIDPVLIDSFVEIFLQDGSLDFLSNDLKTTYPPGMEVEIFKTAALVDSNARNTNSNSREHGTLYIRQHPEIYKSKNIEASLEHYRPDLELELDTIEDLQVIKAIFNHFSDRPNFGLDDVIKFMDENPNLSKININIPRQWKQYRNDQDNP